MNRNELTTASETFIREVLGRQIPEKAHVYLFGSRARQQAHWNADYDLWIDAELPDGLLSRLQEELEESFVPFKVDIVATSQLHGPFGDQVRKEAVPWM